MINANDLEKQRQIEKNIMFVTTIYDSFEALEETLGQLKLEQPLFMIHAAKKAFAEEIFKYAESNEYIYQAPRQENHSQHLTLH